MEDIHEEMDRILDIADAAGISYPLGSLSFVEVPIHLRTIGGGWRMDTTQAQPGIVMLREHTFLKANFQSIHQFQAILPQGSFDALVQRNNNLPHKVRQIREYFTTDLSGGNALDGIARNLFLFRTNLTGPASPALAQLKHAMVSKLLFNEVSYFSPFPLSYAKNYDSLLLPPILTRTHEVFEKLGLNSSNLFERSIVIRPKLNREDTHPSILTKMCETSIEGLSYDEDVETTFDFIDRTAYSKATSLLDGLGHESIGTYLGNLLDAFDGRNFRLDDLDDVSDETQIDLATDIHEWITASALPGFLVSPPRVVRIGDSEIDLPQYQISFHVRNDEPVSGSFSVHLGTRTRAEKVVAGRRLEGNESVKFNLLSGEPATNVFVRPYLALNQEPIVLELLDLNIEHLDHLNPQPVIQKSTWTPEPSRYIVVDDLDQGFSVIDPRQSKSSMFSWLQERNTPRLRLDHGLPGKALNLREFAPEFNRWVRRSDLISWGKYRKTTAMYRYDEPNLKATFQVILPENGTWQLDYHVAQRYRSRWGASLNKYPLEIISGQERFTVELTIEESSNSWLSVGSFDLPSQEVSVVVTTGNNRKGTDYYTVADAIRWSKVEASEN